MEYTYKVKQALVKYKFYFLLISVLILAALLRFPLIGTFPPSMVQDEVGLGYSAVSIAETGKDEWGTSYPLVFKSFGDYKPPAFFYATAILYKVIGWNFALPRITSALAGLFIVLCGSLWIRKLLNSNELGLVAGFILAINPWTVHLSRMALESNLGLAFFVGGLLFFSYAQKSYASVVLSALFFSLSTYSYHGYRFTVLLFLISILIGTLFFNFTEIKKNLHFISTTAVILLLSTLFSLPGFLSNGATNRLDQTLILTSEKTLSLYLHKENNCHLTITDINPALTKICKIKYNKFTRPFLIGMDSYVKHFSPAYLFFSGDSDAGRNPTGTGQFFAILFPLWVIGILLLLGQLKKYFVPLIGYFVALVPSSLSGDPHAIRLSVLVPFALFVMVLGYQFLKEYLKKIKYFSLLFVIVLLITTSSFVVTYSIDTYASHEITATYLSYAKKVAQLSYQYEQNGYVVYADHDLYPEPHIYYAYWNRIDPRVTQESFSKVYEESAGFSRPKQFGDSVFFEEGNIRSFACNPEYLQPTVFFTNDPIKFPAQHMIQDNTGSYNLVHVYSLAEIRANKLELLNYCN